MFTYDYNNRIYVAIDVTFIILVCITSIHMMLIIMLVHALRKEREEHDKLYRKYKLHKFLVDEINKNK